MSDEPDEARTLSPFKIMHRGQDTVDGDDNLIFADFRPNVVSADTPVFVEEPSPKGGSVPEPVPSSGSVEMTGQKKSDNPVPVPVEEDSGTPSPGVDLKPTSSSQKKSG